MTSMPNGSRRPPRACTAAMPSSTPSTPSYLPGIGHGVEVRADHQHGQIRATARVTPDQVPRRVDVDDHPGRFHPAGHEPVKPPHRLAEEGAGDPPCFLREDGDLIAAPERLQGHGRQETVIQ